MTKEQMMVRDFHDRFLGDNRNLPGLPDMGTLHVRASLLEEETAEFRDAVERRDLVAATDALADVLYVVLGTANVFGVDLEPMFAEVHRSNMTKQPPPEGRGKAVKGPDWSPPDIHGLLIRQGWRDARQPTA